MEPVITILITNYNTTDFVALGVDAVRALTENCYRILINDNGSDPDNLARLKEEPTQAALHVAWTLAKAEHAYDGSLRAFSDAWREHIKRTRPD